MSDNTPEKDWYTLLRDPVPQNRKDAIQELVRSNHPHTLSLLEDAERRETDPDVTHTLRRAQAYVRSLYPDAGEDPATDEKSTDVPRVSWEQARIRIFIFVGTVMTVALLTGASIGFAFARQEAQYTGSFQINPRIITPYLMYAGGIIPISIGALMLYHYFIHLFVTRIFKKQEYYQTLIHGTFHLWSIAVGIGGFIALLIIMTLPGSRILFQRGYSSYGILIGFAAVLAFLGWIGKHIGDIYEIGIWRGWLSMFVAFIMLRVALVFLPFI